ncbi:hypothetical protein ABPG72_017705, partial [Tetrahymena utriculariae]
SNNFSSLLQNKFTNTQLTLNNKQFCVKRNIFDKKVIKRLYIQIREQLIFFGKMLLKKLTNYNNR